MALKFTLDETQLNSLQFGSPSLQGGVPAISDDSLLSPNNYELSNRPRPAISDDSLLAPNTLPGGGAPTISDDSLLSPNSSQLKQFDDVGPTVNSGTILGPNNSTVTNLSNEITIVDNEPETRLKSLKYGDFPSRNSDPKPLVTKDINDNPSRNGIELQASARIDDTVRIGKILASKAGAKFTVNQAALAAISVKPKLGGTGVGNLLRKVGGGLLGAGGAITSALAQVPVSGTGLHFTLGLRTAGDTYTGQNGASLAREGAPILTDGDTGLESIFASRDGDNSEPGAKPIDGTQLYYGAIPRTTKEKEHKVTVQYKPPTDPFKEGNFGLGDPGKEGADKVDRANAANINESAQDLIKFFFKVVTPDGSATLTFRAFLDSLNDSFQGDWGNNKYIGRAENFYTYGGFSRNINIGFKIAAQTREEMKPLYEKINTLASATAPTYATGEGATFMRGTFIRATIGDYLRNVPAVLQSISYNWLPSYPWQTRLNADDRELPMVLDCTLSLGVIHDFVPTAGTVPYINSYIDGAKTGVFEGREGIFLEDVGSTGQGDAAFTNTN